MGFQISLSREFVSRELISGGSCSRSCPDQTRQIEAFRTEKLELKRRHVLENLSKASFLPKENLNWPELSVCTGRVFFVGEGRVVRTFAKELFFDRSMYPLQYNSQHFL